MTVVQLHVWRVRPRSVPVMFWSMAVDRRKIKQRSYFAKLLGTGRRSDFGVTSADLTRWAALVVSADGTRPRMRGAISHCTLTLEPTASRGEWSGMSPFDLETLKKPDKTEPVAVLTRARLRPGRAAAFWRDIDPVGRSLRDAEGLHCAFGVGEAPVGFQGTISVWRSQADVVRFAYRRPEHTAVIERAVRQNWYAEELFARFRVLDVSGDREVIGWRDGQ